MNKYFRVASRILICAVFVGAYASVTSIDAQPAKRLFDQYGKSPSNAEKAKLDYYFMELNNSPGDQGYIVVFAPARQKAGRVAFIKSVIKWRGIDPMRIKFVRKTAGSISTQLWIVPPGSTPPAGSP